MRLPEFKSSQPLSMGVELELQILNSRDYNLVRGASDLLAFLESTPHPGEVKPEMTESMIEVNSSVHHSYATLVDELVEIRDVITRQADRLNLRIAGGGAHPFQMWSDQRIYSTPRFNHLSELYGYLAKQFTVFGQHIHIGCENGDQALYLTHLLSRFIPHFIALSASSPFSQGVDTSFDSSRLTAVNAFPLSGRAPMVTTWEDFNDYFDKMTSYRIVESMKDFYWDIRPKPEYGTIEIRVCDTPLTVHKAAAIAAYAQALARYLIMEHPLEISEDVYLMYNYNRFQACRFGLDGNFIDPYTKEHKSLRSDILETLASLAPHSVALESELPLAELREGVVKGHNDSAWLRGALRETDSLNEVVRLQSTRWMGWSMQ
ncbi:YbdK family carboxylate-amine ligase [Geobacter sp. SVR]|uniref:YbdK family carboxylate-amine ligase n=1 Tax=Geobacter sp. SVR TaxID=2495594 RepID=UPI00143EFE06|nr:YbdK family carboxylate-amine ligase [Geobacter sp. SVR]BCS54590.1 putative glutamate--cysteine ligase 2 [Geobacter sp. SVR]GCF86903.1 putative glutamate--cysteine ligase 2 [Geobacter sp. SVR]